MADKKKTPRPRLCQVVVLTEPGKPLTEGNIIFVGLWSDGTLQWRRPRERWSPVP